MVNIISQNHTHETGLFVFSVLVSELNNKTNIIKSNDMSMLHVFCPIIPGVDRLLQYYIMYNNVQI
jgi:hypothetical protein